MNVNELALRLRKNGEHILARELELTIAGSLTSKKLQEFAKKFFDKSSKLNGSISNEEFENIYYVLQVVMFQDIGHANIQEAWDLDPSLMNIMQKEFSKIGNELSQARMRMVGTSKKTFKQYGKHLKLDAKRMKALENGDDELVKKIVKLQRKNSGLA